MIDSAIADLIAFGAFIVYMLHVPTSLHIMQLESYHFKDYFNWLIKNGKRAFKPGAIQFIVYVATYLTSFFAIKYLTNVPTEPLLIGIFVAILSAFYVPNVVLIIKERKKLKKAKKSLKFTARANRLIFFNIITVILLRVMFSEYLGYSTINDLLVYSFLIFTLPFNMIIANYIAWPTEDSINRRYIRKAQRKLCKKEYKDLIRIGITGSYGKTSTKYILQTILSEKYNVAATPGSHNTTMGNVRFIREQLKPEHQVFISEMGARNKNDITEICNFVRPQIGIITSIGSQHLETFKSIENVAKTKRELLDSLPEDGVAVLPRDNKYCYDIYKEEKHKKYLYGINSGKDVDVYAYNIKLSSEGSTFSIATKNEKFTCKTKLLGEHNVENIVGCVAIALHLGLTTEEIARGISKIEPVEHRLQILPSTNGTTIIDDAFNSNPVGSKMALDVLKQFEGRKIIITPGMVELGEKEFELNKEFGRQMAESVDVAILVGIERSKPIEEGLHDKDFDDSNIYVVSSLNEATERLAKITQTGDVVLFENDLPDNY